MKKISLIALSALIALSGAANAQTGFDINAMPIGNIPGAVDKAPTGSIGVKLQKRVVLHDGVSVTQFFTIAEDGKVTIVSEE
jgi:hypothetical protein